ncbi:MarR family transcriptional regulator [Paracoccus caeni]|uniref:MarR family transcriptional regulator n=1 Tax=Paracoccus caeni TaxID=657651 RepID=A0A934SGE8_9RHOB|nr:MarR family transcriptional regulator [Paracoccus caeni]MBK4217392.1 MarR family transcriptional regulator [Paracoccus caeni]
MTGTSRDRTDQSLIALRRILRATELYSRELAHSAGLTPSQLRVLQIVAAKGGSATPKALALQMGVSQATVTALVDRVVARGMVSRMRSELDGRQTNVTLTPAGETAVQDAPDALQQRYVRAFERLDEAVQSQLLASLQQVAAMLDAGGIDAAPVLSSGDLRDVAPKRPRD